MAVERSLATLLRSLQTSTGPQHAFTLLPTATSFLSVLGNPLNISLLASQLLTAPALWDHPMNLLDCRKILSVFNTATIAVIQKEEQEQLRSPYGTPRELNREGWIKAIVAGADEKSPRWRHLLLLGGVLLGGEGQNRQGLPWNIRTKLEAALATAAQLALEELDVNGIDGPCTIMVLNYTFELLSDFERSKLDYDRLLPLALQTTYSSPEGLESGLFLGAIDRDVVEVSGKKFQWSPHSVSYGHVSAITSKPLISALGPLSRLIAHAVENVRDPNLVSQSVDVIADFARTLMTQWRQNKLSEIDRIEESEFLEAESLGSTVPTLWKVLRNCLYSVVIVLRAALGRVLNDHALASDKSEFSHYNKKCTSLTSMIVAPFMSMQSLHVLRSLYFISSRIGQNSSSQHMFITLTSVDILAQYPDLAENLLRSIKPNELGQIPGHPLERCVDLFFLNTAELFTIILSEKASEELLISAAVPYLAAGANKHLLEIFEAAHSVVLAVFAIPKNGAIAAKHLPFYIDNLFAVFPQNLSARQFRLAFKTVIQVTAPPSLVANNQPLLPSILFEVLHDRALRASADILPQASQGSDPSQAQSPPLSEQAALTLALIDSLCFLRVQDLEEWLPLTAHLINTVSGPDMRNICVDRFWDVLSSGEMDVDRAHYCVTWWSTKGGRELVLFGGEQQEPEGAYMSGALGEIARENKL